jgi:hypothetical protein
MSISDSTNVGLKTFLKLSSDANDTATGLLDVDSFIEFTRGNVNGADYRYGLSFTNYDGMFPFGSKTTLIDAGRPANGYTVAKGQKVAWGIDFNALDPQQGAFRSKGMFIDADGTVQIGGMRLKSGTVDMSGLTATSIAYSAGGTGWVTGDHYVLLDSAGNNVGWGVLGTVSNGVPNALSITGGTVVRLPVIRSSTSPPTTLTASAVKGQHPLLGTDFTVSVVWNTTANKLTIGGSGQTVALLGRINMANLPTSTSGLNPGDLWNNGGFLAIA